MSRDGKVDSTTKRKPSKGLRGLFPRKAREERRITKVARVAVYASIVCLGFAAVAANSAYGDVKRSALQLGHELGRIPDGDGNAVRINGETIHIASATTEIPLGELLDNVEARCKATSAGVMKEVLGLPDSAKKKFAEKYSGREAAGIVREEVPGQGMVACFEREGNEPDTVAATMSRLTSVVSTGDLGKLGKLRYVFAETGSPGRTHVIAAWTEGSFNVYSLIPEHGDAPGTDVKDAPRPPNAVRILTADVVGAPYGIHFYDSASNAGDILALYDTEMPKSGWKAVPLGEAEGAATARAFLREGVDLLVSAEPSKGGKTAVSIIETRSR